MAKIDTIETVLELPHPQQKVWNAITTPAGLNNWFGDRVMMTLKEGAAIRFEWDEFGEASGVIETVRPISHFAYRWRAHGVTEETEMSITNSTLVTFELTPINKDQTRLRVAESGFANLPPEMRDVSHRENSHGWQVELEELIAFLGEEST